MSPTDLHACHLSFYPFGFLGIRISPAKKHSLTSGGNSFEASQVLCTPNVCRCRGGRNDKGICPVGLRGFICLVCPSPANVGRCPLSSKLSRFYLTKCPRFIRISSVGQPGRVIWTHMSSSLGHTPVVWEHSANVHSSVEHLSMRGLTFLKHWPSPNHLSGLWGELSSSQNLLKPSSLENWPPHLWKGSHEHVCMAQGSTIYVAFASHSCVYEHLGC